jgi:hypothetical protein
VGELYEINGDSFVVAEGGGESDIDRRADELTK